MKKPTERIIYIKIPKDLSIAFDKKRAELQRTMQDVGEELIREWVKKKDKR